MLSQAYRSSMLAKGLVRNQARCFAAQGVLTKELQDHLTRLGFNDFTKVVHNPS